MQRAFPAQFISKLRVRLKGVVGGSNKLTRGQSNRKDGVVLAESSSI